jgi:hypothetical protein
MGPAKKRRGKTSKKEHPVDSDEDAQTLKKSGKASFERDETFDDSEDECFRNRRLG